MAQQAARLHLGRRRGRRDAVAAGHARRSAACSTSAPARRAPISTWRTPCATPPGKPRSSRVHRHAGARCAGQYQSFTQAPMDRLRAAGYAGQFTPLEEGMRRYVQDYLAAARPLRMISGPAVSAVRPGHRPDRAVRHPLVCAGLYRRPGARLAAGAPSGAAGAARSRRRCRSTISSPGRRWASCSAAGSATCCSISRRLSGAPADDLRGLGRRHELPRRHARRRHRDHVVLPPQRHPAAGLRRPGRGRARRSAWASAGSPIHQRRAVGPPGAGLAALGDDLPRRRTACRGIPASCTRRCWKGWCCSS